MSANKGVKPLALITGASSGLGAAFAGRLAQDGYDLTIVARRRDRLESLAEQLQTKHHANVEVISADLSRPDELLTVEKHIADGNDLELLVNNAGFAAPTPLGAIDVATVRALLDTHVTGVVMLTQTLVPLLTDGGRIVNTSTGLARFTGDFGLSVYASAKGAVEVWTRYLAQELGPRRITVNAIAPGATGTDFGGGSLRDDEQVRAQLGGVIAMGHVGHPEDIGAAVAAITSDRMGWVTGQRIEASGGMRL